MDSLLGSFIKQPLLEQAMETVLFVHGNPPIIKVKGLCGKDTQVVALDIKTSLSLSSAGIAHKTADAYSVPDSNKRAVDFLNSWSCKPLLNGRTIKDLMVYDNFSFWWCMEHWLYFSFFYRDPLDKIIETVDIINMIMKIERPEKVIFIDNDTLYSRVIPILASKSKLVRIICARPVKEKIKEYIRPWGIKQFLSWHARARKLLWRFERLCAHYKPKQKAGKHILAVCSYNWKPVEHPVLQNPVVGDPYITPIVENLKNETITYVDTTQRAYMGFGALKNKARSKQSHVLLEQFTSLGAALRARRALYRIRSAVKSLERSPEFRKSWLLDGIDLWPLIGPQFRCYFDNRLEGHLMDFECAKALLGHEKPDLVMYPCEGGDLAYVFFKLCADKGIPCIGVQHGTMSYSPLSVHAKEEICKAKPQCLPRPTKLLVYGPYYRDFLVSNGNYPDSEISVIGNLRYDHFVNAKTLSKNRIANKYHLDKSKQIVLYAGQIFLSKSEGEEVIRAVFSAAKELDLFLVVKQHPGETSDALYHQLANEIGIKPFITKNTSTLELLTACDVIIGAESTLDYEAMILEKPVIIVNLGTRPDSLPFVKEIAAIGVYKSEDVLPALKNSLFDKKTKENLAKGMAKLIEAHCYKIDGKAAERAAEVARGLIR